MSEDKISSETGGGETDTETFDVLCEAQKGDPY
jgi:hypothetical protein